MSRMSQIIRTDSKYPFYPSTRSQKNREEEAKKILEDWKNLLKISSPNDEKKYMEKFNGKTLSVYEPDWYSNRYYPFHYQGRDMKYKGEETFQMYQNSDGNRKMYVIAETDDWLCGFQFIHHIVYSHECSTGFYRLMMNVVHK